MATSKVSLEKVCELLVAAAGGTLNYNPEFKSACLLSAKVLRGVQKVLAVVVAPEVESATHETN